MKAKLAMLVRLMALIPLYFICFSLASAALLSSAGEQTSGAQAGATLVDLLIVSFLNAAVLAYVILHSRWAGWKLVLTIFLTLFGVVTVMSQIETAIFVTWLPPGMLPRIVMVGAIVAALFSPLAVLILGKRRRDGTSDGDNSRLMMPAGEWIWKLTLIAAVYLILYFTFGYFIAWKNPAVRAYYGGSDPGGFLMQMSTVLRETPWLLPLQVARAMLWTALALPIIRMMKGQWWEAGLAVALLFAVVMNSQLLLPNPFMPQDVRMAHLLETASSNFLFGWLIVWLLHGRRASGRELIYR
jgi:hypothetical protein